MTRDEFNKIINESKYNMSSKELDYCCNDVRAVKAAFYTGKTHADVNSATIYTDTDSLKMVSKDFLKSFYENDSFRVRRHFESILEVCANCGDNPYLLLKKILQEEFSLLKYYRNKKNYRMVISAKRLIRKLSYTAEVGSEYLDYFYFNRDSEKYCSYRQYKHFYKNYKSFCKYMNKPQAATSANF